MRSQDLLEEFGSDGRLAIGIGEVDRQHLADIILAAWQRKKNRDIVDIQASSTWSLDALQGLAAVFGFHAALRDQKGAQDKKGSQYSTDFHLLMPLHEFFEVSG
jgi:hypothetical protein